MTGIQFITDAKGRKTEAVIDLKPHRALWEDIEDVLVSRSRRHEKRIPLEKAKADLIAPDRKRNARWLAGGTIKKCSSAALQLGISKSTKTPP